MHANTDAPLAIVGNLNVDLWVQTLRRFPAQSEELTVDSAQPEMAGTAGYLMLACQGLGIEPLTVSTIGDDLFGHFLLDHLQAQGFSTHGIQVLRGQETPLSMIFIGEDGQRSILSTLGAHKYLDISVVEQHDDLTMRCHEIFLCGNYLLPQLTPQHVLRYAEERKHHGHQVVFDPSWDPAGWGEQTRRDTYRLLRVVDVYLPNEEELTHLTGKADWRAALQDVAKIAGEVVLKRGPHGAVYADAEAWIEVPGFAVDAVNTIGAGDVFDIGYLFARRMGWLPVERVQFACALSAMIVSQTGKRTYPDAATVLAFLHQQCSGARWQSTP